MSKPSFQKGSSWTIAWTAVACGAQTRKKHPWPVSHAPTRCCRSNMSPAILTRGARAANASTGGREPFFPSTGGRSPRKDGLRDHRVHALGAVHQLRDVQVRRYRAQHVGIVARQLLFRHEEVNH